jgi:hypothetical protein
LGIAHSGDLARAGQGRVELVNAYTALNLERDRRYMQTTEQIGLIPAIVLLLVLVFTSTFALRTTSRSKETARFEIQIFIISVLLRFAVSFALYVTGFVQVIMDEDASGWATGAELYQSWERRGLTVFDLPGEAWFAFENPLGNYGYYYLTGVLFFLFDAPARLPAAVLNNVLGALTVVLAYRIAGMLFSQWVARRVAWWSCLMPSFVIWSAQTLKEPIVIFLETAALYWCIRIKAGRGTMVHVAGTALLVYLLVAFRFYAAYFTGAAVVLSLVLPAITRGRSTFVSGIVVGGALLVLLASSGLLARHQPVFQEYSLTRLQMIRDYTARTAGSGVVLSYDLQSPTGLIMSTLVGWAHLLLAPFPWQLGKASPRMLLTVPDVLVWWWLFFFGVLPGLRLTMRRYLSEILPVLFFILGIGTLYSITFSNVGLVYRYRAQFLPWFLIFAMVGLEQRSIRHLAARRAISLRRQAVPRLRMREDLLPSRGNV